MKINDTIAGALLLLFALAVSWNTRSFPSIAGDPVGPALFPRIIAAGMIFCAVALIATGVRRRKTQPWAELPLWLRAPRQLAAFALVTGGLAAFCLFLETIGFLICAPLLLAALLVVLRVRWWVIPIVAIGVSLLIHVVFYKGLGVPLPWGLLARWAW